MGVYWVQMGFEVMKEGKTQFLPCLKTAELGGKILSRTLEFLISKRVMSGLTEPLPRPPQRKALGSRSQRLRCMARVIGYLRKYELAHEV